jgi:hypothetical protein
MISVHKKLPNYFPDKIFTYIFSQFMAYLSILSMVFFKELSNSYEVSFVYFFMDHAYR